ncbi:hypothetical protein [Candidatus Nitrososphaera sp. FF02]|uniref:hypothetical protein n=1 Tax=Candidatus Nitrososphaera sp. FF02 TaxID=3398226 RepID=UPI0039E86BBA
MQNELEAAEFRRHGLAPITHFTDSLWNSIANNSKAKTRITTVYKTHDWRDGKDYLCYDERISADGRTAERMVNGFNLPVIASGKVTNYRPFYNVPFTRKNIQAILKQTDDRTTWAFNELALSESCCKNYKEVTATEFLEAAL